MINVKDFNGMYFSVAMTEKLHRKALEHLSKGPLQEDLAFGLYKFSVGRNRCTAILQKFIIPNEDEHVLAGNVAFTADYLIRVLKEAGKDYGIAFLHSHLGPGWQNMSKDDVIAEKERLASAVAGSTGLPLLGLTMGTDGAWSGRFWLRNKNNIYERFWAQNVRTVGKNINSTFLPEKAKYFDFKSQIATINVWGEINQEKLAKTHIGIIGLGSVGSIIAESLSRIGISKITLIDYDLIEERNLDRTLGATKQDVKNKTPKVKIAERVIKQSHTSPNINILVCEKSLLEPEGYKQALDCDILFSCVDRPWPRHLLYAIAYSHLIPVIDGGIFAKVNDNKLINADWRIHAVGPDRPCMVCIDALKREHISLDMDGKLDDPSYIQGLSKEQKSLLARQNVFPFSMSVAAHEMLQFIGLVTGEARIGGNFPQMYHCYPGIMEKVSDLKECLNDCEYSKLTAQATDLSGNLLHKQKKTGNAKRTHFFRK